MKGGLLGSLIYSGYAYFYQKRSLVKSIVAFLIGAVCSTYLAYPIHEHFQWVSVEVSSFGSGLFAMKTIETAFELNWKEIANTAINGLIQTFTKSKK